MRLQPENGLFLENIELERPLEESRAGKQQQLSEAAQPVQTLFHVMSHRIYRDMERNTHRGVPTWKAGLGMRL